MGADHLTGSRAHADALIKSAEINMIATNPKVLFIEGLLVLWDVLAHKDTLSWVADSTRNETVTLPLTGNSQEVGL
jgi:hypothetical protein